MSSRVDTTAWTSAPLAHLDEPILQAKCTPMNVICCPSALPQQQGDVHAGIFRAGLFLVGYSYLFKQMGYDAPVYAARLQKLVFS